MLLHHFGNPSANTSTKMATYFPHFRCYVVFMGSTFLFPNKTQTFSHNADHVTEALTAEWESVQCANDSFSSPAWSVFMGSLGWVHSDGAGKCFLGFCHGSSKPTTKLFRPSFCPRDWKWMERKRTEQKQKQKQNGKEGLFKAFLLQNYI